MPELNPTRRVLAAGLVIAVVLATSAFAAGSLSPDDAALQAKAVAYLDGLTSAKGRFTQTDGKGRTADGTLYLQRPGKARFEYDPPNGLLITSDGRTVTVSDSRLKTLQRYPLRETPLSLFLDRHIRIDKGVKVEKVTRNAGGFTVLARDARGPAGGQVVLSFADNPIRLMGWTITDAQRQTTRVIVSDLHAEAGLAEGLFEQAPGGQGVRR
ncbi:MAG: outer membrane lipoprotein carrier protein LolA [Caulobacterales bacterium]